MSCSIPKRWKYPLSVALAAVVGVVLVASVMRSNEPRYDGKRLSVLVVSRAKALHPGDRWHEREALREIGSNAMPYLLKWIPYEAPPWKVKAYDTINSALLRLNPSWGITDNSDLLAQASGVAIFDFRERAVTIIPELTRILDSAKLDPTAQRAAFVLNYLGDAGLRALVTRLRNPETSPYPHGLTIWRVIMSNIFAI